MVFWISRASSTGQSFSIRERRFSRHEHQTDPDVSFGWFEQEGVTALLPKPTGCAWIRIPLPKSFLI